MIIKVNEYFREGRFSFYPGETHLVADLIEHRGWTPDMVEAHRGRGSITATDDVAPEKAAFTEGELQAVLAAANLGDDAKTGLADPATPAPMTEGKSATRAKE